jgi:membrane-associated phospholipid phosphatase
MSRILAACALALGLGLACSAQEKAIAFDPLWDSAALASGAGAAICTEFFLDSRPLSGTPDPAALSGLDALACLPYDEGRSKLSLAATGAALLWPAFFALSASADELWPAAASCAEALAWTYAAKDCLKFFFPKARPYVYREASLSGELLDEANESFPSGHTALAFCAATSFAVLATELSPNAPSTPWLVAGGYAAAAAAGALRVAAGEHFVSDVAVGALLGSAIGYLVTSAHIKVADEGPAPSGSSARAPLSLGLASGPSLVFSMRL